MKEGGKTAVTKLWAVRYPLQKCIDYAKNPKKTSKKSALQNVLDYATNSEKTAEDKELLVTGVNCNADKAFEEMLATKYQYNKLDKVQCYHSYQSFSESEVTPERCHKIGVEFAQKMWGSAVQVVVCTHLDKEKHLHNHFVVNSVALDGHKLKANEINCYRMRAINDEICKAHGLSVVETENSKKAKSKGSQKGKKSNNHYGYKTRDEIRAEIDEVINRSFTVAEVLSELENIGYQVNTSRMHTTILPNDGRKKVIRLKSLGYNYTEEKIAERIYNRVHAEEIEAEERNNPYLAQRYDFDETGQLTGFAKTPRTAKKNPKVGFCRVDTISALIFVKRVKINQVVIEENKTGQLTGFVNQEVKAIIQNERKKLNDMSRYSFYLRDNHITKLFELDNNLLKIEKEIHSLNIERIELRKQLRICKSEEESKAICDEIGYIGETIKVKRRVINLIKRVSETNEELKLLEALRKEEKYEKTKAEENYKIKNNLEL